MRKKGIEEINLFKQKAEISIEKVRKLAIELILGKY